MIVKKVKAYYSAGRGAEVRAVDDVTLSIQEGEVFGIVGESGCGKSTLASVISLTAGPTLKVKSGTMELDGDVLDLSQQANAPRDWHGRKVALLPQRAMNSLNPTARIRDVIVDVVRAHYPERPASEAIDLARERLQMLGLPVRVLDSYPHQLSGGMRQRVVAVVSTLLNPKVLIADEPTSALDVSSQRQLVQLMQELLRQGVITRVVFITHDLPMLSNIADRIAVMYAGEVVEIGDTLDIINQSQHPYTQALIGSTLDLDASLRDRTLEGISGAPPDLRYPPAGCRFHPRCPHVMDICRTQTPPVTGDSERFAACWLLEQPAQPVAARQEVVNE